METSKVMEELRKIRDENSARHAKMTLEELKKEEDKTLAWVATRIKKPLKIVDGTRFTYLYPTTQK
jgi:hypothetical protein